METLIPIVCIGGGFLLIMLEVYVIPGFNVIGILGFLLALFGIAWVYVETGVVGGSITLLGSLACGVLLFYMFYRSGAWEKFVLATTINDEGSDTRAQAARTRFLGKVGVARTPLRPTGIVEVDGDRIEVTTEGEYIAAGSTVRILAKDSRRYLARLDT